MIMMDITTQFVILLLTLFLTMINHRSVGHRLASSDSIMDIINTRHIDRLLAERRQNASRDEKRFLIQNDLDDDFIESDGPDVYQSPDIGIEFEYNGRRQGDQLEQQQQQQQQHRRPMDILMQYNDTILPPYGQTSPDILADLQAYRADKLLKSSKNALIVTRKEYLKKDWCKTEPLVQRIREDGCLSRTIINRFCYGQCNSFYIPKSPKRKRQNGNGASRGNKQQKNSPNFEDEDLTGAAFKSCAFCKPKKFTWITVTLRCPTLIPQLRKKRIQRIKQCKCIAEPLD